MANAKTNAKIDKKSTRPELFLPSGYIERQTNAGRRMKKVQQNRNGSAQNACSMIVRNY